MVRDPEDPQLAGMIAMAKVHTSKALEAVAREAMQAVTASAAVIRSFDIERRLRVGGRWFVRGVWFSHRQVDHAFRVMVRTWQNWRCPSGPM